MPLNPRTKLFVLLVVLIAVVAGGYTLFLWLVVNVLKGEAVYGLTFVAVVAGIASFFNPCAFPLLPAFLARQNREGEGERVGQKPQQLLPMAFAAALGLTAFTLLLGAFIGLLGAGFGASLGLAGDDPNITVRWLRGIVGVLLMYLGFSHATRRGNSFRWLNRYFHHAPTVRDTGPRFRRFFVYGFGYSLLGIGCGGPILGGLAVYALSRGGFGDALFAFLVYALVMALLMLGVAMLVALSRDALLQTLQRSAVAVQRISGLLLLTVGAFLFLSSVFVSTFTGVLFP